jgi:hypothetical protein
LQKIKEILRNFRFWARKCQEIIDYSTRNLAGKLSFEARKISKIDVKNQKNRFLKVEALESGGSSIV